MNIKYVGSIIGLVVGLFTWMISNVGSYSDVRNNWMFVAFFVLVMGTLGGILAETLADKGEVIVKKGNKSK